MSEFSIPSEREMLYLRNARETFEDQVSPWLDPIIDTLTPAAVQEAETITRRTSQEGWLYDELTRDMVSDGMDVFLSQPEVITALLKTCEAAKQSNDARRAEQADACAKKEAEKADDPNKFGSLIAPKSSAILALARSMEAFATQPEDPANAQAALISAMEHNVRNQPTLGAMLGKAVVLDEVKRQSAPGL